MGCLGAVSNDSPGESGSVYAAFAYAMQNGGCPYDLFTPEACTAGFGAWETGINNGLLKIDPASFHDPTKGEVQKYMYTILSTSTDSVPSGTTQAANLIASAANQLGISKSQYIAPVLINSSVQQVTTVLPAALQAVLDGSVPINAPPTVPANGNPTIVPTDITSTNYSLADFTLGLQNIANPGQWTTILSGGNVLEIIGLLSPIIAVGAWYMLEGKKGLL